MAGRYSGSESQHEATVRVLENSRTDCSTGNEAAADFVASLAATELTLETPRQEDYSRSAEVPRQYSDAKLDFVDTLIVALAERLNITRVLTLDVMPSGYESKNVSFL